jgi:hypothetical protein
MDIGKKLDEIRQKPENIRMRYVWGAVGISMILVVGIWIFSIKEAFKSTQTEGESGSFTELKNQFNAQKENMPSFDNLMNQPQGDTAPESIEGMELEGITPGEQMMDNDKNNKPETNQTPESAPTQTNQ